MSTHLRDDNVCQNCGYMVEEIYCPRCGQKNTETRQSFGHLVGHFAEDLTHYDSGFWRTIKYLLFRPAKLTKEYLQGRRQVYVPPVKLYIFISFITFFLPSLLPDLSEEEEKETEATKHHKEYERNKPNLEVKEKTFMWVLRNEEEFAITNDLSYTTIREMDSIEALKPEHLRMSPLERHLASGIIRTYQHNTPRQVGEKFNNSFFHTLPKSLFIYMPIFALWLWLFHGKKRWYFFDHAIFTLHYFSFLLLTILVVVLLFPVFSLLDGENGTAMMVYTALCTAIACWQIYYFYRGHRKMYYESFGISFIKSTALFIINLFCILLLLAFLTVFTLYNLH